jgi:DNA-directed RNA polymerase specialized sigma24 family protein
MVQKVSQAFRTDDHDDLEAELAAKLLKLKRRLPVGIRDWLAFLVKFLYNKAANWVRDERAREKRRKAAEVHIQERAARAIAAQDEHDLRLAVDQVRAELPVRLQRFWDDLVQEGGKLSKAAPISGIHRNTARHWRQKIRRAARRHGAAAG